MRSLIAEERDFPAGKLLEPLNTALDRASSWLAESQEASGAWPSGFGDVDSAASTAVAAFAAKQLDLSDLSIQDSILFIQRASGRASSFSVLELTDVIHWGGKVTGDADSLFRPFLDELSQRDWRSLTPQESANVIRAACYSGVLAAHPGILEAGAIYCRYLESLQPYRSSRVALDESILPVASIMWTFGELLSSADSCLRSKILAAHGRDLRHLVGRLAGFAYSMQRDNGAIVLPRDHEVDASACLALGLLLCGETVYCEQLGALIEFLLRAEIKDGGWSGETTERESIPFVSYYTIIALSEYRRRCVVNVNPIFRARGVLRDEKLCFVLMPFGPTWSRELFENCIAPSVESTGLRAVRADDINSIDGIMEDVWKNILGARVVIADLTDRNPNVMYEVGIAHTVGKSVVLITQDIDYVPFDLRALRCIVYTNSLGGAKVLTGNIANTVRQILAAG